MNKQRFRYIIFIFFILLQFTVSKFLTEYKINIDFMYLILLYFIMRKSYIKAIIAAVFIGWLNDYFTGSIIGIYGFSRVSVTFILYGALNYIDPKRLIFAFLIIFASLTLSNFIANLFLLFIYHFNFNIDLLMIQPFLTAMTGILLLTSKSVRKAINVH